MLVYWRRTTLLTLPVVAIAPAKRDATKSPSRGSLQQSVNSALNSLEDGIPPPSLSTGASREAPMPGDAGDTLHTNNGGDSNDAPNLLVGKDAIKY